MTIYGTDGNGKPVRIELWADDAEEKVRLVLSINRDNPSDDVEVYMDGENAAKLVAETGYHAQMAD